MTEVESCEGEARRAAFRRFIAGVRQLAAAKKEAAGRAQEAARWRPRLKKKRLKFAVRVRCILLIAVWQMTACMSLIPESGRSCASLDQMACGYFAPIVGKDFCKTVK